MSQGKINFITLILFLIAMISLIFIFLDFFPLISANKGQENASLYSYSFKAIVVLLTTLLVFITGKDHLDYNDSIRMKIIFLLILLADLSLALFPTPVIGIFFFSLVQLGLILRNSLEMKENIRAIGNYQLRSSLFINIILVTIFFILNLIRIMDQHMDEKLLLVIMVLYGMMISISLWTAIANYLLKLFLKTNSIMISLGMIFFVLCDINVGLSLILPASLTRTISLNLIWVFYTPALTLLALSGYRYKPS